MPFTKARCAKCGAVALSERQFTIDKSIVHLLKCGHLLQSTSLDKRDAESIRSLDGRKLYPFQIRGVQFLESSGGRALIADEMGLGKTVQALATLALHPEMLPAVYIVKSSLKIQWQHEIMRWTSEDDHDDNLAYAQIVDSSKDPMLKGMKHYIFSFDLLRRFNGSLVEKFDKLGIKTVVIDECQQIKNPESARAKQVRELCKGREFVIGLSGTPIKNNASEYFSILNILRPEIYSNYSRFVYNDCDSYHTGYGYKVGGLRYPEQFMKRTESFIIRRERKQVMPDLPVINRQFQFHELSSEVEKAYQDTFKNFRDDYFAGNGSFQEEGNILAYLSKMRHLTGLSKVNPVVDFVEEFLESTDRKLTIFAHHIDVADILYQKLSALCKELNCAAPLALSSKLNGEARASVVARFMSLDSGAPRILIASTLASGEGLNLQECSDCVMMERQWNPANEEQAEGRFIRIGRMGARVGSVNATYMVATGTVDEFFSEIVEKKREIVAKTLGGEAVKWDQSSLMKELAATLASVGGRKWGW